MSDYAHFCEFTNLTFDAKKHVEFACESRFVGFLLEKMPKYTNKQGRLIMFVCYNL